MTHERDDTPPHPLTAQQQARLSLARCDLEEARAADLATIDPAALVMMVEKLRSSLYDTVRLLDEVTQEDR